MKKGTRTSFVVFTYMVASMMIAMVIWQGFMVAGILLSTFVGMPSFATMVGIILNIVGLFSGVTIKVSFWLGSMISKSLDIFLQAISPEASAQA